MCLMLTRQLQFVEISMANFLIYSNCLKWVAPLAKLTTFSLVTMLTVATTQLNVFFIYGHWRLLFVHIIFIYTHCAFLHAFFLTRCLFDRVPFFWQKAQIFVPKMLLFSRGAFFWHGEFFFWQKFETDCKKKANRGCTYLLTFFQTYPNLFLNVSKMF